MKKSTTLSDIADIRTGIFARPEPSGEFVYLQAKHFDEFGRLKSSIQPDLPAQYVDENHRLMAGDVLFAAKGSRNFGAIYSGSFPATASTTFFVSRIRRPDVLPDYLVWYLNEPATQELLRREAIGSSIVSIPKSSFARLEVPLPPVEMQLTILKIADLANEEYRLRHQIAELRQQKIRQQITKSTRK